MTELDKIIQKFPLDSIVTYRSEKIGKVIGYKRANGNGSLEVIFQHFPHLASGRQSQFSIRARNYLSIKGE